MLLWALPTPVGAKRPKPRSLRSPFCSDGTHMTALHTKRAKKIAPMNERLWFGRMVLLLLLCVVCVTSCALPLPPQLPPVSRAKPSSSPPVLTLLEGQERGLLLSLSLPLDGPEVEEVTLLRQTYTSRSELLPPFQKRLVFQKDKHRSLWDKRQIRFLDQKLEPGKTYRYLAIAKRPDRSEARSEIHSILWKTVEPPTEELKAKALGDHIHLSWPRRAETGTQIFRRRVDQPESYRRVTKALPETQLEWTDDAVERGAIYAYTLSRVQWSKRVPLLSTPGAEVYIEADTHELPTPPSPAQSSPNEPSSETLEKGNDL